MLSPNHHVVPSFFICLTYPAALGLNGGEDCPVGLRVQRHFEIYRETQVKRGDGRVKPSKSKYLCNVEFKLWYSLPSGHRGAKKKVLCGFGEGLGKAREEKSLESC